MKINWKIILLIVGAFVLASIPYIIFTRTTSSPTTLSLNFAKKEGQDETDQINSGTKLTLLLLKDNRVFGYQKIHFS